ncbi:hypothetical protein ACRJ4W_51280 [Streptomyces sp. GLT-R25]
MTPTENTTTTAENTRKTVLRSSLGILSTATATHGTGRDGDIPLPRLPGFVESAFSPLAYEAARLCLAEQPGDGARTAVALASTAGDTTTADLASRRMVSGRVHNPLLFMQATPNSVLGCLSREFGITWADVQPLHPRRPGDRTPLHGRPAPGGPGGGPGPGAGR